MKTLSTLFAFLAAATVAAAGVVPAYADVVDKRQKKQSSRIQAGYKSGKLTPYEYSKLKQQQRVIAKRERKFERDGRLSKSEKQRLDRMQDKASRSIYAEKHDRQKRWWNPWNRYSRNYYAPRGPKKPYPYWYQRFWWAR